MPAAMNCRLALRKSRALKPLPRQPSKPSAGAAVPEGGRSWPARWPSSRPWPQDVLLALLQGPKTLRVLALS